MTYEGWVLGIKNSGVDDEVSIVGIMDANDNYEEIFCFDTIARQLKPYVNKWIRYKLDESGACIEWFEPIEECDEHKEAPGFINELRRGVIVRKGSGQSNIQCIY